MSKFIKVAAVSIASVAVSVSAVCMQSSKSDINHYNIYTVGGASASSLTTMAVKTSETDSLLDKKSISDVLKGSCTGSEECVVPSVDERVALTAVAASTSSGGVSEAVGGVGTKKLPIKNNNTLLVDKNVALVKDPDVSHNSIANEISKPSNLDQLKQKKDETTSGIIKTEVVRSNDTFISACRRLGVKSDDITDMIYGGDINESSFTVKPEQIIDSFFDSNGNLIEIRIHDSGAVTYRSISKKHGMFKVTDKQYPHSVREVVKEFLYSGDLKKSAKQSGLSEDEASKLYLILKDRVNFLKLNKETVFKVDYTETIINKSVNEYDFNAIKITSKNYNLSAYNFKGNFYDSDGESLSPSFLRHPLAGQVRVTSHFNRHRFHPILHIIRPHWGTDYGVPIGTKILSISDATVVQAGKARGFGNRVILKHPGNITTIAAHMLRVAKGIEPGVKVKKGQVIGFVGKTGLSTGPHLHFEMRINGKRVDSLKAKLPVMSNVSKERQFQDILKKCNSKLA
ncbi:peptidoglycan DD-metalloendopeptidase family protein [Photobacterium kishitanii]|uniref:Uncharacterized protein n=1 Tax=Photobacterium kishitanii TaxID=318456 RepID=A0A2T3KMZ9_9GAMM|nr:peptidoglycan DD-metalloendopeptidase family protein [Photobacterium kishitanii]PSV01158.1 hypothetical protein C9J27_03805 [Photobacterium kishitanii]